MAEDFFDLTPEKILAAVEMSGLRCTGRCLQLNSMENRVYEVEIELDEDVPLKSRYEAFRVVKFYRPGRWTRAQILEEHAFVQELAEAGLPAVAPIPDVAGSLSTLGEMDGLWFAVFPKVGGRSSYEMDDAQLARLGHFLAQQHRVGAEKAAKHRLTFTAEAFGTNNMNYLLQTQLIPLDLEGRYRRAVEALVQYCEPRLQKAGVQRIHGDCHLGNVLWGNEGPFWLDFDDMVMGPVVQDIWLMVPNRDAEGLRQREIFLQAYESILRFDREQLHLIEGLRALRYVHYSAWIARRWKDPYFPRAFPHFKNWEYWNEQVTDLESQIHLLS